MKRRKTVPGANLTCLMLVLSLCLTSPAHLRKWKVTYYCSCRECCGKWADGYFASGKKAYNGGVACNWLPFGTELEIDSKIYVVEDRGKTTLFGSRALPVKHIDIWVPTHREAIEKGVEWKNVKIIMKRSKQ